MHTKYPYRMTSVPNPPAGLPSPSWRTEAACQGIPTDMFYATPEDQLYCIQVCNHCPVMDECLRDALAWSDVHGIRGGTTGDQRRKALKRAKGEIEAAYIRLGGVHEHQ